MALGFAVRRYEAVQILWLVAGAASGAAAFVGDPGGALIAAAIFLLAVVKSVSGTVVVPAYLSGAGVTGLIMTLALSPAGYFAIDESGRSRVCSSSAGCHGVVATHAAFAIPAFLVFLIILVVGAIWLIVQQERTRQSLAK